MIFGTGFHIWCHFEPRVRALVPPSALAQVPTRYLSRGFEFLHRFEHRVRVLVQFFTIAATGFEFLCNSDQMVRIWGVPHGTLFSSHLSKGFEVLCNSDQMVRILGCPRAGYFQVI